MQSLQRVMAADEVARRVMICARILDAWPNARPTNRDRTLLEYVNATRGVAVEKLPRCIQLAIDAGGDFMPPAGEIIRRAAVQAAGGPLVGSDADRRYWHELKVSRLVQRCRDDADTILPVIPEEIAGQPRLALGDGR
jgi:hypothetical protein